MDIFTGRIHGDDTFAKLIDKENLEPILPFRLIFIFSMSILAFVILLIRMEITKFKFDEGIIARFFNKTNTIPQNNTDEYYTSNAFQRVFSIAMVLMFVTLFYGYKIPVEVRISLLTRLFIIDLMYINNIIKDKSCHKVLKDEFYWLIE